MRKYILLIVLVLIILYVFNNLRDANSEYVKQKDYALFKKDSLSAIITGFKSFRGLSITLSNEKSYNNLNYHTINEDESIIEIFGTGDSIYKKSNNDTFFVFRNRFSQINVIQP